jgi:M6 family metalloprotease-like protein
MVLPSPRRAHTNDSKRATTVARFGEALHGSRRNPISEKTMKRSSTVRWLPFAVWLILMSGLTVDARAQGVTLEDFGYQNMKVNGSLSLSARPTLVILLDLANTGTFAHSNADYDNLVFNPFNTNSAGLRSVNGFMLVSSHGRFSLTRVGPGLIGPLQLPADQTAKALTNDNMRAAFAISAAVSAGVNFAPYDANDDGKITANEVAVLIFDNVNPNPQGATRWANPDGVNGADFTPAGSTKSFSLRVALAAQRAGFSTICHEFTHAGLNTVDLYGGANGQTVCYNNNYTIMSCTIGASDDMLSFGLDAWHKLQLGWIEPRIRSLPAGGVETIAAAQIISATDAPIILYDPARGTSEFFLLEYRTSTSPSGPGYQDNIPSNGLGIWHVVHDGNKNSFQYPNGVPSVWLEGQPNLQPGTDTNLLWTSSTTTPFLAWTNGAVTSTRIAVKSFNPGDGSITIEWLTASETWVDFQYNGTQVGTFAQPFKTLSQAVNAASHGGTVKFKTSGASAETLSITKRLDLRAIGGPVTIGQ